MEKPSFKDKQEQLASLKKRFTRTSNAELLKEMRKLEDELIDHDVKQICKIYNYPVDIMSKEKGITFNSK